MQYFSTPNIALLVWRINRAEFLLTFLWSVGVQRNVGVERDDRTAETRRKQRRMQSRGRETEAEAKAETEAEAETRGRGEKQR